MGLSASRKLPLSKISSKMLSNVETKSASCLKVQVLSPELCSAIFRRHPLSDKIRCWSDEIESVKKFLLKSSNFEIVDSRDFRSKVKLRKMSEKELLKAIRNNRKISGSQLKVSGNAEHLRQVILGTLKTELRWTIIGREKRLLSSVLLPELETLSGSSRFGRIRDFIRSVFLWQLDVKKLRKNPRGLLRSEGMCRYVYRIVWVEVHNLFHQLREFSVPTDYSAILKVAVK